VQLIYPGGAYRKTLIEDWLFMVGALNETQMLE
jgi:hypothetical protein